MDASPPGPSGARLFWLVGAGGLSLGLAALACRYAWLPLDLPGWKGALLTGGPIGLAVSGVQSLRRARRLGGRPAWLPLALAALLPAAVVVALYAWLAPARASARLPLVERDLPGLRVALPDWEARDAAVADAAGRLLLDDPGGGGRFVEVRWALAPPLRREELVDLVTSLGGLALVGSLPATVDGRPAETLRFDDADAGKRVALTAFTCPDDGLAAHLLTFVDLPPARLLALHDRVLATVRCVPRPGGAPAARRFPRFTPPPGYTLVPHPHVLAYAGPGDAVFDLPAGAPGRELVEGLARLPDLLPKTLQVELGLRDVRVEPQPVAARGPDGDARLVRRARGVDEDGADTRVLVTWWYCEAIDHGFIAIHAGPPDGDEGPVLAALAGAACPEP